jgi:hypothetical protein
MPVSEGIIRTQSDYIWIGSPVTVYEGSILALREQIPIYERRTFGPELKPLPTLENDQLFGTPSALSGVNHFHDVIVRMPTDSNESEIPVGIVSKQYALIQHRDLFDEALAAIKRVDVAPSEITARIELTAFGERMRLSLILPERYNLKVRNDMMGLRLECFNSVDGSMKFTCVIGWLRFVCSNGLVVGVADTYYKQRHNRSLEMNDIAAMLSAGIDATTREKDTYTAWSKKIIKEDKLIQWTNRHLAKQWGVKAAARTWHITHSGRDITFVDPFEKGLPTEKSVHLGMEVPGAILPGNTVYAVAQTLAWLAKERRDIQEQLQMKREIHELLRPLLLGK